MTAVTALPRFAAMSTDHSASPGARIELAGVTKRFLTPSGSVFTAVQDVTFTVEPGLALAGIVRCAPNGADRGPSRNGSQVRRVRRHIPQGASGGCACLAGVGGLRGVLTRGPAGSTLLARLAER